MQINHTIFERKHHYMAMMKEIEKLRRQMEYEALNDEISKERLNELYHTRQLIFAGLLREGLFYQYIQNSANPEEDKIKITVDNVDYDCKVSSLKRILGEDFNLIIKETDRSDLVPKEVLEEKITKEDEQDLKNEDATKSDIGTETLKDNSNKELEIKQEEKEEEIPIPIPNTIITDNNKLSNNEIISKENEEEKKEEILIHDEDIIDDLEESEKEYDTFVYDYMNVTPIREGAVRGETFIIYVAPLELFFDNNRPDIAVWCKGPKGTIVTGVSDNIQKPVKINCDGQSFIIRGTFKNGIFESHILPADSTLNMGFDLKINKDSHCCLNNKIARKGHIFYTTDNMGIHVFPVSETNEKNGNARCLIVVDTGLERKTFSVPHLGGNNINVNNKNYGILNYWDGTILISELMNEIIQNDAIEEKSKEKEIKEKKKNNIGSSIFSSIKRIMKKGIFHIKNIISTIIHIGLFIVIAYVVWKLYSDTSIKDTIVNFVIQNVAK